MGRGIGTESSQGVFPRTCSRNLGRSTGQHSLHCGHESDLSDDAGALGRSPCEHEVSPLPRVEVWRRLALYLLLFGIAGTTTELILLGHFEDRLQWTPLVLLGLGFMAASSVAFRPSRAPVTALRALMALYLPASALGVYLHLKSNVEFELEMRPSMAGIELVMESLSGAMPALAPGAMAQLGFLGLLVCFRHPARATPATESDQPHTQET